MQTVTNFLTEIVSVTRESVERKKMELPVEELKNGISVERREGYFSASLSKEGISVIAEIKRASPSRGVLRQHLDVAKVASSYEKAGASAISVLTEEKYFMGSLEDLQQARQNCELPLLRKDFIIDKYQIWEAAFAGADAVLLIAAILSRDDLKKLMAEAEAAGLEVLVEAHDLEDVEAAVALSASIIGINNRDLRTFNVNPRTSLDLRQKIPKNVISVAESGIKDKKDVAEMKKAGFDAVLVGEILMRNEKPEEKLIDLLSV